MKCVFYPILWCRALYRSSGAQEQILLKHTSTLQMNYVHAAQRSDTPTWSWFLVPPTVRILSLSLNTATSGGRQQGAAWGETPGHH